MKWGALLSTPVGHRTHWKPIYITAFRGKKVQLYIILVVIIINQLTIVLINRLPFFKVYRLNILWIQDICTLFAIYRYAVYFSHNKLVLIVIDLYPLNIMITKWCTVWVIMQCNRSHSLLIGSKLLTGDFGKLGLWTDGDRQREASCVKWCLIKPALDFIPNLNIVKVS